eukprot:265314-Amorphochlora_amoeboformis.AAC.2
MNGRTCHPLLVPVIDDVQARLRGLSDLIHGVGTWSRVCPAYGVSKLSAIKKIYRRPGSSPNLFTSSRHIFRLIKPRHTDPP